MSQDLTGTSLKRWKTGVIIGKFLPPHRGHHFLIETALSQVEQLTVFVCERDDDFLAAPLRAAWLHESHPAARVIVVEDRYDPDDSRLWAQKTREWFGTKPDVVFTSENYGARWAHFLECEHVLVDLKRTTVPASATQVRENVYRNWEFLAPSARAHFARRVVVLGAESSGTTTLALDLAAHFNTVWVPEFGRDFCAWKWQRGDYEWRSEEFHEIAREQSRREDALAREANRVLACDTDAFATRLWHWRYCGFFSKELDEFVASRRAPDLYLLTDVHIPFVQDGMRDGENIRHAMHEKFIEELEKQAARWELISGTREERIETAVRSTSALL